MCIIAIKKAGVPFPTESTIENMWYSNPDGAGIMYTDGSEKVMIDKGYMTLKEFLRRIDRLKDEIDVNAESIVLHFRIGTHGGNTPENTHPFPVSSNVEKLQSLHIKTNMGIAHNGIIRIKRPIAEISDTMEYIRTKLSRLYVKKRHFYKSDAVLQKIEHEIDSKMAFLLPNKQVYTVGSFITDTDGMMYSNSTFIDFYGFKSSLRQYSGWFDDVDEMWGKGDYTGSVYGESLMFLPDESYLVEHTTGAMYECEEVGVLMIDASGFLYVLDYDEDSGIEYAISVADDVSVFDKNGNSIRYNIDDAMYVPVCDCSERILTESYMF